MSPISAAMVADVADLGGDGVAEHPADAGHRHEVRDVGMVRAETSQVCLAAVDLTLQLIDHMQAGGQGRGPGLLRWPAARGVRARQG